MDQIKLLQQLGFTEYEARAYLSLALHGQCTVREVVMESHLPRNKAYEALQRLEQKNLVFSLPLSPRQYKISDPEVLSNQVKEMQKSITTLMQTMQQQKEKTYKDLFWMIKGKRQLLEKFAIENEKAQKEILSCSDLDRMLYKNMRIIHQFTKRGGKVKFITPYQKKYTPIYREWKNVGVELRIFNQEHFGTLFPRVAIFDGEKARITMGTPEVKNEEDYLTLWTESKTFAQMLRNHFLIMWKKSKQYR